MTPLAWFSLGVSFLADFMGGFVGALGASVAVGSTTSATVVASFAMPTKAVWIIAAITGFYSGVRALNARLGSSPLAALPKGPTA